MSCLVVIWVKKAAKEIQYNLRMNNMNKKLTLVSISFSNRKLALFVNAPMINGKAIVSDQLINSMLDAIGCSERGLTYSIG